jgi:sugar phosphate isomerase/epimerase
MRDLANRPELLSLNCATVRQRWNLRQIIDGCQRHGIRAMAPWRDQVAAMGLDAAAKAIRAAGLRVNGYCRGGMFTAADAAARQKSLDDNRRAVDEAAAIGADCLVRVVGGVPTGSKGVAGAHAQVEEAMARLLEHARPAGMKLALEPLHPMYAADRACVNTLRHANDICERLGEGIGVAVDVYHTWWDPTLQAEIMRAGKAGRILGFHVCDWLVPTADMLLDRGMMGDGVIDIPLIRGWVEAAGYDGFVEAEIFSANNWWKREPDEVLAVCKQRFASVC